MSSLKKKKKLTHFFFKIKVERWIQLKLIWIQFKKIKNSTSQGKMSTKKQKNKQTSKQNTTEKYKKRQKKESR